MFSDNVLHHRLPHQAILRRKAARGGQKAVLRCLRFHGAKSRNVKQFHQSAATFLDSSSSSLHFMLNLHPANRHNDRYLSASEGSGHCCRPFHLILSHRWCLREESVNAPVGLWLCGL